MNQFALFSCAVKDFVFLPEIYECESVKTEVASIDKSFVEEMHSFVEVDEVIFIVIVENNYAIKVFRDKFDRVVLRNGYVNIRV